MAATYAVLSTVNSAGTPKSSGSVTPGAGKVLFALCMTNGSDADPTFGGSLGGTWTKVRRDFDSATNSGLFYSTDYAASGVFTLTGPAASTWADFTLFTVTDTGLRLSNPVKQSAHWSSVDHGGSSVTARVDLDVAPTKPTFMTYQLSATFLSVGAGMTDLVHDQTFTYLGLAHSAAGQQSMTITQNASNSYIAQGYELQYGSAVGIFKMGWRR